MFLAGDTDDWEAAVLSRSASTVFMNLPLLTTVLTNKADNELLHLMKIRPAYEPLIRRFQDFECRLFSAADGSCDMHDIRQLFRIRVIAPQAIGKRPQVVTDTDVRENWSPAQYGRLCSFLTVYRLVDTLAFVAGVSRRAPCMKHETDSSLLESLPGSECLMDWTDTILRLQDVVQDPSVIRHRAGVRDSVSRRLMAFLRLNAKSAMQCRVMLNLTIAAMHIAYLKELRFPQRSLPDLPDRISDDMVECAVNSDEKDFLVDLQDVLYSISGYRQRVANGGLSLASFRGPLQVALALSPVYLLTTKLLGNKVWNKRVVMDVSCLLGNNKPSALLSAEKIIWNVLFLLADGQLDPREVLLRLNHDMPWDEVRCDSKLLWSRYWFHQSCNGKSHDSSASPPLPLASPKDIPSPPGDESGLQDADGTSEIRGSTSGKDTDSAQSNSSISSPHVSSSKQRHSEECAIGSLPGSQTELSIIHYDAMENRQASTAAPLFLSCSEEDFRDYASSSARSGDDRYATQFAAVIPGSNFRDNAELSQNSASEGSCRLDTTSNVSARDLDGTYRPREDSFVDSTSNVSSPATYSGLNKASSQQSSDSDFSSTKYSDEAEDVLSLGSIGINCEEHGSNGRSHLRRSQRLMILQTNVAHVSPSDKSVYPPSTQTKRHGRSRKEAMPSELTLQSSRDFSRMWGTPLNPIDVDQISFPSMWDPDELDTFRDAARGQLLNSVKTRHCTDVLPCPSPVQSERKFLLFDPLGRELTISPSAYTGTELQRFSRILDRVAKSYVDGKALHVLHPRESLLVVMQHDEFSKLGPEEIREILSNKHIVVRKPSQKTVAFERDTLNRIYPIHSQIPLQDYAPACGSSTPPTSSVALQNAITVNTTKENVHGPRARLGSLHEFLDHDPQFPRKVLATVRVPLPQENTGPTPFSTDAHAWHHTRGRPSSPSSESFPSAYTRWSIVSTAGALDALDFEPAGYNSFRTVVCGVVVHIFPRGDASMSCEPRTEKPTFSIDNLLDNDSCDFEAVLLNNDYTLYMRAAQPYLVYSHEDSIVQGGYFYLSGLMRSSLHGLIASFTTNNISPNTFEWYCPRLLRCIMEFYSLGFLERKLNPLDHGYKHLPQIHTVEGLLDLLSLCNILVLSNVIDFRTYLSPNQSASFSDADLRLSIQERFDRTEISRKERISMIYARGLAFDILRWVSEFCEIRSADGSVIPDYPSRLLTYDMSLILESKRQMDNKTENPNQRYTLDQLQLQMDNVAGCNPKLSTLWSDIRACIPSQSFSAHLDDKCTIRWKDWPEEDPSLQNILQKGLTALDIRFAKGELKRSAWDMMMPEELDETYHTDISYSKKRIRTDQVC